jgi:hypothetical protein
MRHPCSIAIFMKQLIGLSKIFNTLINHLVDFLLFLEEISNKYFLLLSRVHMLRLLVPAFNDLTYGFYQTAQAHREYEVKHACEC